MAHVSIVAFVAWVQNRELITRSVVCYVSRAGAYVFKVAFVATKIESNKAHCLLHLTWCGLSMHCIVAFVACKIGNYQARCLLHVTS